MGDYHVDSSADCTSKVDLSRGNGPPEGILDANSSYGPKKDRALKKEPQSFLRARLELDILHRLLQDEGQQHCGEK